MTEMTEMTETEKLNLLHDIMNSLRERFGIHIRLSRSSVTANHRVDVSQPGFPRGHWFFESLDTAIQFTLDELMAAESRVKPGGDPTTTRSREKC